MTSLVEEFQCANTSLEMTLSQYKDPGEAVQHAQGALQHRDIIGHVQSGRVGFGLGDG